MLNVLDKAYKTLGVLVTAGLLADALSPVHLLWIVPTAVYLLVVAMRSNVAKAQRQAPRKHGVHERY